MTIIAHAGDWLVSVLYIVPLLVVVGMLAVSAIRDRRRGDDDDDAPQTTDDEGSEP